MKKILPFLLAISLFSCVTKEQGYKITGTISDIKSAHIKLLKLDDGKFLPVDSTKLVAGQFTFSGKIENPDRYYIQLNDDNNYAGFFIENSNIEMNFNKENFNKPIIKGSKTQELYDNFVTKYDSIYIKRIDSVRNLYDNVDNDVQREVVDSLYDAKNRETIDFIIGFSTIHNKSVATPYIAYRYLQPLSGYENEDLSNILNILDSNLTTSAMYKLYAFWVNQRILIEIGKPAIDFTMNDTAGHPFSLLSFKTKYLLLDFWSSKCGPCRKEHPNLLKVYKKYKTKGFEIFAVSFDDKKEEWIAAIKKDKINWPQVSALTGWDNEALDLYCIQYIPQNVLIDENGIIIAKNLNTEKLGNMLEEFFGNQNP